MTRCIYCRRRLRWWQSQDWHGVCHRVYRLGWQACSVESEARERHVRDLLADGVDPWHLEQWIRERAA